jgi:putative ABC transport system permease protein
MRSPLGILALQHLRARPIRTALTILGVAVGISSAMAIRLSNEEVLRSFQQSVSFVTGDVTIQISAGEFGINENLIRELRIVPGVAKVSPVLREPAIVLEGPRTGQSLVLWGLDLIDQMENDQWIFESEQQRQMPLEELLATDTIFLNRTLALQLGIELGNHLIVGIGGHRHYLVVRGFVEGEGDQHFSQEPYVFMDIASMQHTLNVAGRLHRINVVTQSGYAIDTLIQQLQDLLPPQITVSRPAQRNQQVERMIQTFQLNIFALSMVGLLVGIFLIYNTVAFSVVQYRKEIGILRAIGFSRIQVGSLFVTEAALLGFCGGVIGTGFGVLLAEYSVILVSQSVSELYASVSVPDIHLPLSMYGMGGILGLLVAMAGALGPCVQAARTLPARALSSGTYEEDLHVVFPVYGGMAFMFFLLAGVLAIPGPVSGVPVWGYASAFCVLLACTCLGPLSVQVLGFSIPLTPRGLWRLASDQLIRTPGRNSVTISALMVGISIMIGVSIMVHSFRHTVEIWIDQTLMADMIIAPVSWLGGNEESMKGNQLPVDLLPKIEKLSGVVSVDPYRQVRSQVAGKEVFLVARDFQTHADQSQYFLKEGQSKEILLQARDEGGILISEVLSESLQVGKGDDLSMPTPEGNISFSIMGVFYDYATDGGKIVMDRTLYEQFWGKAGATVLAVYLDPKVNPDQFRKNVQEGVGLHYSLSLISNAELRKEILEIFDRTFRVTHGLELIALVVAILGIVNTLITSILERQREFSTFRAIGASQRQIQMLIVIEALLLSLLGAILGLVAGLLLGWLLIEVINKQSFGWTIQMMWSWTLLFQAVGVSMTAALLASWIPAQLAVRRQVSEGLRYE